MRMRVVLWFVMLVACATPKAAPRPTADPEYGPLEVGADYATYHKVSSEPFLSKTHGGRFVEVYVNEVGHSAYVGEGDFPVGSVIVKTSWEAEDGKATSVPGPIFVMRKEAAGYAPSHKDWYYAIHWADPTAAQRKVLGGPIYWRGHSPKVGYCYSCHDNYDRSVGGLPQPDH